MEIKIGGFGSSKTMSYDGSVSVKKVLEDLGQEGVKTIRLDGIEVTPNTMIENDGKDHRMFVSMAVKAA